MWYSKRRSKNKYFRVSLWSLPEVLVFYLQLFKTSKQQVWIKWNNGITWQEKREWLCTTTGMKTFTTSFFQTRRAKWHLVSFVEDKVHNIVLQNLKSLHRHILGLQHVDLIISRLYIEYLVWSFRHVMSPVKHLKLGQYFILTFSQQLSIMILPLNAIRIMRVTTAG
jgi:hypothetical protein